MRRKNKNSSKLLQNLGKQLEEIQFNKDNKAKVKIDSQVAKKYLKTKKSNNTICTIKRLNPTVFK